MRLSTRSLLPRHVLAASLTVLTLILSSAPARAVPPLMNYQGYLTDNAGAPRTGAFPMTFALFANPTGGSSVWSESYASISVSAGVFSVLLGEATALPWGTLLTGNMLWLETTVDARFRSKPASAKAAASLAPSPTVTSLKSCTPPAASRSTLTSCCWPSPSANSATAR